MASVQFKKMHSVSEVKNAFRHCDKNIRQNSGHRNKHIQQDKTKRNIQTKRNYKQTCEAFDKRLEYLDKQPKANKKADRVICFGLEVPAPKDLPSDKLNEWASKVYSLVCKQYGSSNVMNCYVHVDEVHDYVDSRTLQKETSRSHLHLYVVPEINNKLNGKVFSSVTNMRALNNSIHEMTKNDYGCDFMDGSKRGSRKTVEQLKQESEQLEAERHLHALKERERLLQEREQQANEITRTAYKKLAEAREEADKIVSEANEIANNIISEANQKANKIIINTKAQLSKEITKANDTQETIQQRTTGVDHRPHTPVVKHKDYNS